MCLVLLLYIFGSYIYIFIGIFVGDQQRSDSKQKDVRLSNIIAAKGKFPF